MLGLSEVKVYLVGKRKAIKLGKCGDNFGYFQDIDNLKQFSSYGYNTAPVVGSIRIESKVVKTED